MDADRTSGMQKLAQIVLGIWAAAAYTILIPTAGVTGVEMAHAESSETSGLQKAIALHDAARKGNEEALKEALAHFKRLVKRRSADPVARAYLGSTYALAAREAWNPFEKTANVNRSLRHLDAAVRMAPDNFTVRMIRANVQLNLPRMFSRHDEAVEDLLALDRIFRANPTRERAKAMLFVYEKLMENAPQRGDWKTALEKAQRLAKGK